MGGFRGLPIVTESVCTYSSGVKAKAGGPPFLKCATAFPLLLWHPYARHHYFCVMTEKEHKKWLAVFQDCIRHANNGKAHGWESGPRGVESSWQTQAADCQTWALLMS